MSDTERLQWVDQDGNPIARPTLAQLGAERVARIAEAMRGRTEPPPPPHPGGNDG